MRQEIEAAPSEAPIVCVLAVLGLLSYLATFSVMDLRDESLLVFNAFNITTVAGFICGLFALPLGLKLGNMKLKELNRYYRAATFICSPPQTAP